MWLHHDIGWWGFVLAVATLILAYPLDVLAHLTTPKLKVWWAIRSLGSATEKLEGLVRMMKRLEAEPELSHSAAAILAAQKTLVWFGFGMGYTLLMGIIFATGSDLTAKVPNFHPGYLKLLTALLPVQMMFCVYALLKIEYGLRTSKREKERLREEIRKAEVKLGKIVEKNKEEETLS